MLWCADHVWKKEDRCVSILNVWVSSFSYLSPFVGQPQSVFNVYINLLSLLSHKDWTDGVSCQNTHKHGQFQLSIFNTFKTKVKKRPDLLCPMSAFMILIANLTQFETFNYMFNLEIALWGIGTSFFSNHLYVFKRTLYVNNKSLV